MPLTDAVLKPGHRRRTLLLAIIEGSSRHNLGHIERNINIPTFPMVVLHPENQWRFAFRDRGVVAENGRHALLISFQERGRLRVIRDRNGRDVRTQGSMLLDGVTGELVSATMEPQAADLYSHLEVTFGLVEGVPRRVPVQMWEWYWQQGLIVRPIPPGEILMEVFMRPLGIGINALARDLTVSPNRISGIVGGTSAITADMALRLGKHFGVSPELWLDLQSDFDLRVARQNV